MPCSQFVWSVGLALRANLPAPEAHTMTKNQIRRTVKVLAGRATFAGRLAPREFADVEIPVTAISDSDGFLFEFVNDLIHVDVLWENVHEQISGTDCKDARPLIRPFEKGRFNGVNGVNVAGDAGDTIFIGVDG